MEKNVYAIWNWCCEHPLGATLISLALFLPETIYGVLV